MIYYIYHVVAPDSPSHITVVRANTQTDAYNMLMSEMSKPDEVVLTLVESTLHFGHLN